MERADQRAPLARTEQGLFRALIRIAQVERKHESVELRFRQRVGADLLDGILGGDDENGVGSGRLRPSVLTCPSSMASRRALWALGVARLTSSARMSWAKR